MWEHFDSLTPEERAKIEEKFLERGKHLDREALQKYFKELKKKHGTNSISKDIHNRTT